MSQGFTSPYYWEYNNIISNRYLEVMRNHSPNKDINPNPCWSLSLFGDFYHVWMCLVPRNAIVWRKPQVCSKWHTPRHADSKTLKVWCWSFTRTHFGMNPHFWLSTRKTSSYNLCLVVQIFANKDYTSDLALISNQFYNSCWLNNLYFLCQIPICQTSNVGLWNDLSY